MSHKYVYLFSEGNGTMRELLGGKGANLAEMTVLGMPVPQGFTVSTEACTRYYDDGRKISSDILRDACVGSISTLQSLFLNPYSSCPFDRYPPIQIKAVEASTIGNNIIVKKVITNLVLNFIAFHSRIESVALYF